MPPKTSPTWVDHTGLLNTPISHWFYLTLVAGNQQEFIGSFGLAKTISPRTVNIRAWELVSTVKGRVPPTKPLTLGDRGGSQPSSAQRCDHPAQVLSIEPDDSTVLKPRQLPSPDPDTSHQRFLWEPRSPLQELLLCPVY